MAYSKYYPNGWRSGEVGNTPITPEALNHMEAGIEAALTSENVVNNLTSGGTTVPLSAEQGKWLQQNKAPYVDLLTDAGTWAKIYAKLSVISSSTPANAIISPATASLLSGGKCNGYAVGTVTRTNAGQYSLEAHLFAGNYTYRWQITGLTSASATPTIGAVYRYAGTEIT